MTAPKRPTGLAKSGRDLWDSIVPKYELRPDEYRTLLDACKEADLIDKLEKAQSEASLVTKGSMGQAVISPFISELRQHRTVLANLLKSLKLPDSGAGADQKKNFVSEQARAAARARWGTARQA